MTSPGVVLPIDDEAGVYVARQQARALAHGLSEEVVERAAIVVSELGHNQIRHGKLGEVELTRLHAGLRIRASDVGPGLVDPLQAFGGKGPSPAGGLQIGLAAVRRLSTGLDVFSRRREGLTIVSEVLETATARRLEAVCLGLPHPDEAISGDHGTVKRHSKGLLAVLADGLGHGPEARKASELATRSLAEHPEGSALELLERADRRLRGTRGAAVAVAQIADDFVDIAVAGNIRVVLLHRGGAVRVPSVPRIVGAGRGRTLRMHRHPLRRGTLLLATDGIRERGLPESTPAPAWPLQLAHRLILDHARADDDVTVLAVR